MQTANKRLVIVFDFIAIASLDLHVGDRLSFYLRHAWDRLDLLQEFALRRMSTDVSIPFIFSSPSKQSVIVFQDPFS